MNVERAFHCADWSSVFDRKTPCILMARRSTYIHSMPLELCLTKNIRLDASSMKAQISVPDYLEAGRSQKSLGSAHNATLRTDSGVDVIDLDSIARSDRFY